MPRTLRRLGALLPCLAFSWPLMLPRPALAADAVVTVKTDPRDAEIFIDGNRQANGSPAVLHVSPGEHALEARKPGYKPARETVFVGDGAMVVKELQLARDIPVPVPIAEQERPETYLNPKRDAFETEAEFAARRQALIQTFNTRSAACDPAFAAGTATLVKDGYDIQTGKFPVELKLKDWSRGLADVSEPQVRLDRDAARKLYQGGTSYPVFLELAPDGKLKAARLGDVSGTRLTSAPKVKVKVPAVKVDMVRIRAGNFLMGCQEDLCDPWEKPVHRVQIAAFDLGKYEVTFADWDACTGDGGCKTIPEDRGWGRGNRPVFNISRDDIEQYVTWLGRKTGQPYRLPSEAEWEYAARAGTSTRFSTGKCISTEQANYDGTWPDIFNCGTNTGVKLGHTQPVGSYPANPWGLYDMHGNVCEWVADCWNENYNGAPGDGSAWLTDGELGKWCPQGLGVLRGGGSGVPAWVQGSNFRTSGALAGDQGCGFRVAKALAP